MQFGFRSPTLYRVPLIIPQSVLAVGFVLLSLAYVGKVSAKTRALRQFGRHGAAQ